MNWPAVLSMTNSSRVFEDDLSQQWVQDCPDLRTLERNIRLTDFEERLKHINIDFEFRVLDRITKTNMHEANMVPQDDVTFGKNRITNYSPFVGTQVSLQPVSWEAPGKGESRARDPNRRRSTGGLGLAQDAPKKSLPVQATMKFDEDSTSLQEDVREQVVYDPRDWYINASYIHHTFCKELPRAVIVTQYPRQSTLKDFFVMLQQARVRQIVMLCKKNENEVFDEDCYFEKEGKVLTAGRFKVRMAEVDKTEFCHIRNMAVQAEACETSLWEEFVITHYKFRTWPDFGVVEEKHYPSFLALVARIHTQFYAAAGTEGPAALPRLLVHCRAGIGRSGAFVAVFFIYDYLLSLKRLLADKSVNPREDTRFELSVFGTVRKIRECRWGAVDKPKQYFMIYQFTAFMIRELLGLK